MWKQSSSIITHKKFPDFTWWQPWQVIMDGRFRRNGVKCFINPFCLVTFLASRLTITNLNIIENSVWKKVIDLQRYLEMLKLCLKKTPRLKDNVYKLVWWRMTCLQQPTTCKLNNLSDFFNNDKRPDIKHRCRLFSRNGVGKWCGPQYALSHWPWLIIGGIDGEPRELQLKLLNLHGVIMTS